MFDFFIVIVVGLIVYKCLMYLSDHIGEGGYCRRMKRVENFVLAKEGLPRIK